MLESSSKILVMTNALPSKDDFTELKGELNFKV